MISYTDSIENITEENLQGFFDGWIRPLSPSEHLRVLENSDYVVLAIDERNNVVGFISAISDGILCAYIPLLEVLPKHRSRGIGSELMKRMLERLKKLNMVDLLCDPELQPFYERFGMEKACGMMIRRYCGQTEACDSPNSRDDGL